MKKRPLPKNPKPKPKPGAASASSIADTIARVSGLATRALEPSDEDVARLLALEAARRPLVGGRGGVGFLNATAPAAAAAAAAKKPNVNKHFLANTIRSVSSHNRREEEAECWRAHGAQKRMEGESSRGGRPSSSTRSRSRSRSWSRSRSRDKKRRSRSRSGSVEGNDGGHVPLQAPPAPRIVGRDGSGAAATVADRWERGVALSPPRSGGSGPSAVVGVDGGGASVSSSSASGSSSSPRRIKRAKKEKKRKKKKEKKRRKK